jgi:hypothetical protein
MVNGPMIIVKMFVGFCARGAIAVGHRILAPAGGICENAQQTPTGVRV